MWSNPCKITDNLVDFAKKIGCNWIGAVPVCAEAAYDYDNCHNNVHNYTSIYGGVPVLGWYFIEGYNTIQAIRHTVWCDTITIDVTPYRDDRDYIIFGRSADQTPDYSIPNCYLHSFDKYFNKEPYAMYYVYQLVDPRNEQPFYIGKGKGRRAKTHLWDIPETRNVYKENKIKEIRNCGLEPKIEYIAENIIDESLAYDIEEALIKKYGRKGYNKDGILTNVCINNRPPNHKGKTYEEIYGSVERADAQRKLRSQLQKERGGYGPTTHTPATREKISKKLSGRNNPRFGVTVKGTKIAEKISKANSGKKHYSRTKLVKIEGDSGYIFLYLNELKEYCKINNYSYSTFRKQLLENWPTSRKGRNKGMKISYAQETDISSYVIGGTKQDVDDNTFKGFSF